MIADNIERYIPHRESMRLIDAIDHVTADMICCVLRIDEGDLFYDTDVQGIPAQVALEWMAQAVAAYAGIQNGAKTQPDLGLLLSVRGFSSSQAVFSLGERLLIRAHKQFLDDQIGVFHCEIASSQHPENIIATGTLNTIQPSPEKLMQILAEGAKHA